MDTTALRVLAIVLIANSHLEDLYPFRQLAADGLLGNALFFMLSGLGIALSPRTGNTGFFEWYRRRLSRIYPSLWLTVLVGIVLIQGAWRDWTSLDFLTNFVWPTPYGFLAQIVLFYPAFYAVKALGSARFERGLMLALTAMYAAVAAIHYDLHLLSWIFYFQMMLFGGMLAGQLKETGREVGGAVSFLANATAETPHPPCRVPSPGGRGDLSLAILTVTMIIYVGVKLGMTTGRIPMHVGVLHLLAFPIVYSLLGFCGTATIQNLSHLRRLGPVLALIGGLTLEIYLVHGFVYHHRGVANLPFPVNLAAFWMATLPLAWIVKAASDRARRLRLGPSRVKPSLVLSAFSPKNRLEAASCDTNRG